jgi:hypothetical protein
VSALAQVIVSCVWGALPPAIGLFPQEATLPISKMEKEFQVLSFASCLILAFFLFHPP